MYRSSAFRFLLVDDNQIIRRGLRNLISKDYQNSIIDDAENSFAARNLLRKNQYDLIVLSINRLNAHITDSVLQLKAFCVDQKILVLSSNSDEACANKFLSLGIKGYLSNKSSGLDIRKAMSQVFQDQSSMSGAFLYGA